MFMLSNLLLKELLQVKCNHWYIINKMDTQVELNLQLQLCLTNKRINTSRVLDTRSYYGKSKSVLMPLMILVNK